MKKILYIIAITFILSGCFDNKMTKDDIQDGNEIELKSINNSKTIKLIRTEKGFYIKNKKNKVLIIEIIDSKNIISTLDIPELETIKNKYGNKVEVIAFLINYDVVKSKLTEVPDKINLFDSKYANAMLEIILDDNKYEDDIIKLPMKVILKNGKYTTVIKDDNIYFGRIYLEYVYRHLDELITKQK